MIVSVHLSTVTGEELLTVHANDLDLYVTLTVHQHSVDLTRDQVRQAADALRARALTAIDASSETLTTSSEHQLRSRTKDKRSHVKR